jgi:hypothetical protein
MREKRVRRYTSQKGWEIIFGAYESPVALTLNKNHVKATVPRRLQKLFVILRFLLLKPPKRHTQPERYTPLFLKLVRIYKIKET